MCWRLLTGLGLASVVAAGSACATSQPPPRETVVLRSPSEAVPAYVREIVAGKTITLFVPQEIRPAAIDYFRAAGAVVIDGGHAALQLEAISRSEIVYHPLGLTVNSSRVAGQNAIVELQLKGLRPDGSRQILLQGRGTAFYDGQAPARGIDLAGRRALINLH